MNDARVEAFITKLIGQDKSIPIPLSEEIAKRRINFYTMLCEVGLISEETRDKNIDNVNAITLNEDMMNEYIDAITGFSNSNIQSFISQ